MSVLPPEIQGHILEYLPASQLPSVALVSQAFQKRAVDRLCERPLSLREILDAALKQLSYGNAIWFAKASPRSANVKAIAAERYFVSHKEYLVIPGDFEILHWTRIGYGAHLRPHYEVMFKGFEAEGRSVDYRTLKVALSNRSSCVRLIPNYVYKEVHKRIVADYNGLITALGFAPEEAISVIKQLVVFLYPEVDLIDVSESTPEQTLAYFASIVVNTPENRVNLVYHL